MLLRGLSEPDISKFISSDEKEKKNLLKVVEDITRDFVTENLSEVIKRRVGLGSSSLEIVKELTVNLKNLENQLTKSPLLSTKGVISEIRGTKTFLQDRMAAKGYDITLEFKGSGKNNAGIRLPENKEFFYIGLRNSDGNLSTREPFYERHLHISSSYAIDFIPEVKPGILSDQTKDFRVITVEDFEEPSLCIIGMPFIFQNGSSTQGTIKNFYVFDNSILMTLTVKSAYQLPALLWDIIPSKTKNVTQPDVKEFKENTSSSTTSDLSIQKGEK